MRSCPSSRVSECECTSIKPGATTSPLASTMRPPGSGVNVGRDRSDGVAIDTDVREKPRVACAVDNASAADDEIKRGRL